MELINKRALMYQLHKQSQIDSKPRAIRRARRIVEECPTVDAIPTQWLYDLADKKEEEKDIKLSAMIKGVVALWHREKEKQNANHD